MIRPAFPLLLAGLCVAAVFPATVVAAPPPAGSAVFNAAPRCAATAEAAARGIVGSAGGSAATADAAVGYRVQDLVLDPVLRRAYVRVADCQDSRKPLTLVALDASLAVAPAAVTHSVESSGPTSAASGPDGTGILPAASHAAAPTLIARGDAVEIDVRASNVRMTLHGRASEPASSGAALDVILDAEPGTTDPPRHMHGIAIAAHRVEVQR